MVSNDSSWGIEPPKDADGNAIPFDTDTLYDTSGQVFYVTYFHYSPKASKWFVGGGYTGAKSSWCIETDKFLLAPPDSWEKLEEDARKIACEYADAPLDKMGMTTCDGCRFQKHDECYQGMMLDVLKRAKKLAGIEEQEGGERTAIADKEER